MCKRVIGKKMPEEAGVGKETRLQRLSDTYESVRRGKGMGRKNFRLQGKSKNVSARLMGSPQSKVGHERSPTSLRDEPAPGGQAIYPQEEPCTLGEWPALLVPLCSVINWEQLGEVWGKCKNRGGSIRRTAKAIISFVSCSRRYEQGILLAALSYCQIRLTRIRDLTQYQASLVARTQVITRHKSSQSRERCGTFSIASNVFSCNIRLCSDPDLTYEVSKLWMQ